MAQPSVRRQRLDPYKNFKFRLKWDGKCVAGISKLTVGLNRTTEVVQYRQGGDPSTSRKSPGRTKYDAVTLEQGVTHDTEFQSWANNVWAFGGGLRSEISLKNSRKDIILEFYNEAGQLTIATGCIAAGFQSILRCRISTQTQTPWRFNTSSSKMKAGSGIYR